jgi:hypothetical protein
MRYRLTTDQGYGHRLFDRIQKQSAARKPTHHLGMNERSQRTQTGVCKLAVGAQFDLAIRFVGGSHQCRIGNTELQVWHVHESDPLSLMTVAQR